MRCGLCGASSKVLDTREDEENFLIKRRRICENKHRFLTYETNYTAMPDTRVDRRERFAKNAALRVKRWQQDQEIWLAHSMGEPCSKIGRRLGITKSAAECAYQRAAKERAARAQKDQT